MKLTVIGCAGLFPSASSPASSYLLEANDLNGRPWKLLLDLGSGALSTLQRHVALAELDAILLSSLKIDHCADLWGLYVALRDGPTELTSRVPIYGPANTLSRMLDIGGSHDVNRFLMIHDVIEWADRVPVAFNSITITPYRVSEFGDTFGFRVTDGGPVIAYTGDAGIPVALSLLADRADLLLVETTCDEGGDSVHNSHLTGQRAGDLAAVAQVGRLVLTHIPVWGDNTAILAEAAGGYVGQVELAEPGRVYVISRSHRD